MSLFKIHERAMKVYTEMHQLDDLACQQLDAKGKDCVDREQRKLEDARADCPGLVQNGLVRIDMATFCPTCRVRMYQACTIENLRNVMTRKAIADREAKDKAEGRNPT